MKTDLNIEQINLEIQAIKKSALALEQLGDQIPAVNRNARRIQASTKMLRRRGIVVLDGLRALRQRHGVVRMWPPSTKQKNANTWGMPSLSISTVVQVASSSSSGSSISGMSSFSRSSGSV